MNQIANFIFFNTKKSYLEFDQFWNFYAESKEWNDSHYTPWRVKWLNETELIKMPTIDNDEQEHYAECNRFSF